MDSAYVKNAVGSVLAKAIAETVVAQPSNPQQYLALYLLHHAQEEDYRRSSVAQARKADQLHSAWVSQRVAEEEAAMAVLARAFRQFRLRLQRRRREQARLQARCEDAEAQAEELLERAAARRTDADEGEGGGGHGAGAHGEQDDEAASLQARVRAHHESMQDTKEEFYKAQSAMQQLHKSHWGALKHCLMQHADRIRAAQDGIQSIHDTALAAEQQQRVAALAAAHTEQDRWAERVQEGNAANEAAAAARAEEEAAMQRHLRAAGGLSLPTPHLSQAAQQLLAHAAEQGGAHRTHTHIHVPHVAYRVLRCVCYLLLDRTPKSTDSASKVAALIKPAVWCTRMAAFSPVMTYDPTRPLRLRRLLGLTARDRRDRNRAEDDNEGGQADDDETDVEEEAAADDPAGRRVAMPTTRQVRRAQRVLRTTLLDADYVPELNYADYFDEEDYAAHPALREAATAAADACARAAAIREGVTAQCAASLVCGAGGALAHVLRFVRAAVAYRLARDAWLQARQEAGLPIPPNEELAEEEEVDEMNDEALLDEEGRVDRAAVQRLQARIGVDVDEALAKLWEREDRRRRRALRQSADAYRRMEEANEEGEGEGGEGVDEEEDER